MEPQQQKERHYCRHHSRSTSQLPKAMIRIDLRLKDQDSMLGDQARNLNQLKKVINEIYTNKNINNIKQYSTMKQKNSYDNNYKFSSSSSVVFMISICVLSISLVIRNIHAFDENIPFIPMNERELVNINNHDSTSQLDQNLNIQPPSRLTPNQVSSSNLKLTQQHNSYHHPSTTSSTFNDNRDSYHEQHSSSNHNNNNNNNDANNNSNNNIAQLNLNEIPLDIYNLCSRLPHEIKKQLKMCKLIDHQAARAVVAEGAANGLEECKHQFKSSRWNCTHYQGENQLLTGHFANSLGNKEASFIHAITAAGISHTIARACSMGTLSDCACDKSRVGVITRKQELWKWGGCSDNIRYGFLFAKNMVELLDTFYEHHLQQQQQQQSAQINNNNNYHSISKRSPILLTNHQHHHNHNNKLQHQGMNLNQDYSLDNDNNQNQLCHKNANMTQTMQMQLMKSILSKNSLERHHEFRLAMNMHNNKVGRMVSNS